MTTDYELLNKQIEAFAETEREYVSLLSNAAAAIYDAMDDVNWAGFYLMNNGTLLVGPFQGKPACIRIEVGRGVCGTAVKEDRIIRVDDVHEFPGHIVCDAASNSEIVIPIHHDGQLIGVLDIDSPVTSRFTAEDEKGLSEIVKTIEVVIEI